MKRKLLFSLSLILFVGLTSTISADEIDSCCLEGINGAICDDISQSICSDECTSSCIPSDCNLVNYCEIGCCFDGETGLCSPRTPKGVCEAGGGEWTPDESCSNSGCRKRCCALGGKFQWISPRRCEILSENIGIETEIINEATTEATCLQEAYSEDMGACVSEEGLCEQMTHERCDNQEGDFYTGKLCSHPSLETICERQNELRCIDGLDEVYWVDSCGNKENIFNGNSDSEKETAWNNGEILSKEDSCNPDSSNMNSDICGNCNRHLDAGSTCGTNEEELKRCVDMGCKDAIDTVGVKDRAHAESWCVYDALAGGGKDVPGSQHWRYVCIDGVVSPAGCDENRMDACIQKEVNTTRGIKTLAECVNTGAWGCLEYNNIEEGEKVRKCEADPSCILRRLHFGEDEKRDNPKKFTTCVPQFPLSFDLSTIEQAEQAEEKCRLGQIPSPPYECRKYDKGNHWSCVSGCDCDSTAYLKAMNELCTSIGDCGADVNLIGELATEGYAAKKIMIASDENINGSTTTRLYLGDDYYNILKKRINLENNFYITKFQTTGTDIYSYLVTTESEIYGLSATLRHVAMAAISGRSITRTEWYNNNLDYLRGYMLYYMFHPKKGYVLGSGITTTSEDANFSQETITTHDPIVEYSWGENFNEITNDWNQVVFDKEVTRTEFLEFFGGKELVEVLGNVEEPATYRYPSSGLDSERRYYDYDFKCYPWKAPPNGDDCDVCNTRNPLKPCTKYFCESLGKWCSFINKEDPALAECITLEPDNIVPTITPREESLTEGYKYEEITLGGFKLLTDDDQCIPQFATVDIGINTDEYAKCKINSVSTVNFSSMTDYFQDSLSRKEHTRGMNFPSAESIVEEMMALLDPESESPTDFEELRAQVNEEYNQIKFYVRCSDLFDQWDPTEYLIETCVNAAPDTTTPLMTKKEPASGSYLAYDTNETTARFYFINEPAECKFDTRKDRFYEEMTHEMSCETGLYNKDELKGWYCDASFTNLSLGNNKFYIKCKDQPWLEGSEDELHKRNTNKGDEPYEIFVTTSPLIITSITPEEESLIEGNSNPFEITLELRTSGGKDDTAICEYVFSENGIYSEFSQTGEKIHQQTFNKIFEGDHRIFVRCEDDAGNIAETSTSFILEIDDSAPKITRVYEKELQLFAFTDENSECAFSTTTCNFNFEDGIKMSGTEKVHVAEWISGRGYYIKCKDGFDNTNGGCAIMVKT